MYGGFVVQELENSSLGGNAQLSKAIHAPTTKQTQAKQREYPCSCAIKSVFGNIPHLPGFPPQW